MHYILYSVNNKSQDVVTASSHHGIWLADVHHSFGRGVHQPIRHHDETMLLSYLDNFHWQTQLDGNSFNGTVHSPLRHHWAHGNLLKDLNSAWNRSNYPKFKLYRFKLLWFSSTTRLYTHTQSGILVSKHLSSQIVWFLYIFFEKEIFMICL